MTKLPALDPAAVPEKRGSIYPEPFRSRMGDRAKRRLGDACGLTRFGVNLVTLGPGGQSALRHWHTLEDEFVYVLTGEVVLVTNDGEQTLGPGMCAGLCGRQEGRASLHQPERRGGNVSRDRQPRRRRQRVLSGRRPHVGRGRERRLRRAQGRPAVLSDTAESHASSRRLISAASGRIFRRAAHLGRDLRGLTPWPTFPPPIPALPPRARRFPGRCSPTRCSAPRRSSRSCRRGIHFVAPLMGLVGIAGLIVAYVKRDDAQGTWVASHLTWLIRTFWFSFLWGVVGAIVLVVLGIILIGIPIAILIWAVASIWVIYRVIRGYLLFKESKPIPGM